MSAKPAFPTCLSRLSATPPIHKNPVSGRDFYICDATGEPTATRVGLPVFCVRGGKAGAGAGVSSDSVDAYYGAFCNWNELAAYLQHFASDIGDDRLVQTMLWVRKQALDLTTDRLPEQWSAAPPLGLLKLHGGLIGFADRQKMYVPFNGGAIHVGDDAAERAERAKDKPPRQKTATLGDHVLAGVVPSGVTHLEAFVWPDLGMTATRTLGIRDDEPMLTEFAKSADVTVGPSYAAGTTPWVYSQPPRWNRAQEAYRKKLMGPAVAGTRKRKAATEERQIAAREKKMEDVRTAYDAKAAELAALVGVAKAATAKGKKRAGNAHTAEVLAKAGLVKPN